MVSTMSLLACPDWIRRNHASWLDLNSPSKGESVRVALVPIA
jgi:hypothetical protein